MNWLSLLLGGLKTSLPTIKEIAEVFVGNKKDRDATSAKNDYDEQVEIHKEQAAGYTHNAPNRNMFDSAVDGINRLVRPVVTFGIMSLFVWAAIDPPRFTTTMKALDTIPQMLWTIMAMVMGLWFGSRTLAKDLPRQAVDERARNHMAVPPNSGSAARPRVQNDRSENPAIDEWRRKVFEPGN